MKYLLLFFFSLVFCFTSDDVTQELIDLTRAKVPREHLPQFERVSIYFKSVAPGIFDSHLKHLKKTPVDFMTQVELTRLDLQECLKGLDRIQKRFYGEITGSAASYMILGILLFSGALIIKFFHAKITDSDL